MRSLSWLMCMALMDGSFIDMGACPRGARLCARLSGSIIASLESSDRSSYADFRSVDDDATSGGKQGMTGGEDQTRMADRSKDPDVARVDDPRALDRIPDRPVRHRDGEAVAAAKPVGVAKRRAVGRAVPRDGHRAGLAREGRRVEQAGPALEVVRPRAADDDSVEADAGDAQPP